MHVNTAVTKMPGGLVRAARPVRECCFVVGRLGKLAPFLLFFQSKVARVTISAFSGTQIIPCNEPAVRSSQSYRRSVMR
jgi:hypothetical protein